MQIALPHIGGDRNVTKSIIGLIADGERDAVDKLISVYGGAIWTFAKAQTKSEPEAEDAVQEIFLNIWKCSGNYRNSKLSEIECIDLICRQWLVRRLFKKQQKAL